MSVSNSLMTHGQSVLAQGQTLLGSLIDSFKDSSIFEVIFMLPQRLLHAAQLGLLCSWKELIHFTQDHYLLLPLIFSANILLFGTFPQVTAQLYLGLVALLKELLYIALWPFSLIFAWIQHKIFPSSATSILLAQPPSNDSSALRSSSTAASFKRDPLYRFRTDFDSDEEFADLDGTY